MNKVWRHITEEMPRDLTKAQIFSGSLIILFAIFNVSFISYTFFDRPERDPCVKFNLTSLVFAWSEFLVIWGIVIYLCYGLRYNYIIVTDCLQNLSTFSSFKLVRWAHLGTLFNFHEIDRLTDENCARFFQYYSAHVATARKSKIRVLDCVMRRFGFEWEEHDDDLGDPTKRTKPSITKAYNARKVYQVFWFVLRVLLGIVGALVVVWKLSSIDFLKDAAFGDKIKLSCNSTTGDQIENPAWTFGEWLALLGLCVQIAGMAAVDSDMSNLLKTHVQDAHRRRALVTLIKHHILERLGAWNGTLWIIAADYKSVSDLLFEDNQHTQQHEQDQWMPPTYFPIQKKLKESREATTELEEQLCKDWFRKLCPRTCGAHEHGTVDKFQVLHLLQQFYPFSIDSGKPLSLDEVRKILHDKERHGLELADFIALVKEMNKVCEKKQGGGSFSGAAAILAFR